MSTNASAIDFAAGTIAGVAQILIGHPFDTVKLNLQMGNSFAGPLDAVKQIVRQQGALGLYRGITPPLATVAAYNALLFGTTGTLNRLVRPDGSPLTAREAAFTGALTSVPVSLLATPTELVKCRLQRQGGARPPPGAVYTLADAAAGKLLYRSALDGARKILQYEGGLAALFRGFAPTLVRETVGNAAYFGMYVLTKQKLAAWQGLNTTSELGPGSLMAAGGVAGAAFWLPTIPVDVIKSRIQTDNPLDPQRSYRGMLDCARSLVRSEGLRGMFRGWQPCLARSVPANAGTFFVYEMAHSALTTAFGVAQPERV